MDQDLSFKSRPILKHFILDPINPDLELGSIGLIEWIGSFAITSFYIYSLLQNI